LGGQDDLRTLAGTGRRARRPPQVDSPDGAAAAAGARLVPESRLCELEQQLEELRLLLGRQPVALRILEKQGLL